MNRETKAYADANAIIARTKAMMMNTYSEGDAVFDGDWLHALAQMVGHKTAKSCARVMKRLSKEAKRIVQLQPGCRRALPHQGFRRHSRPAARLAASVQRARPPFKQRRRHRVLDLCVQTVFNDDFVDRGSHQVEVACLMFALKVAFPSNNGDRNDGGLGSSVYRSVHACFEWLPFACVVADRSVVNW